MERYEWDLEKLYPSFDSPSFQGDLASIDGLTSPLEELLKKAKDGVNAEIAKGLLLGMEALGDKLNNLGLYTMLRLSTDAENEENTRMNLVLARKFAEISPLVTRVMKALAEFDGKEAEKAEKLFADYRFYLQKNKEAAAHFLSDDAEEMYAMMNVTGGDAWATMHGNLTSTLKVDYNGGTTNLSAIRNLAYSADASERKAAYEAELAAYPKIEQAAAFAMNNIKLQSSAIARKRGFASALEMTLDGQNMTKKTLDAMLSQIKEYLPEFHRYLKAKSKLLGHEGGLPWYDLFAPVGNSKEKFSPEEAGNYLVETFSALSDDMASMMKAAFKDRWIDFYPRDGKRGGAFCAEAYSIGESRILTNFDGTFSAVDTLAHELGHAFHNFVLQKHRSLNREGLPMSLAETASTFNETFLMNHALAGAGEEEQLALLDSFLIETTQIMCDIYSRYRFETMVYENCENGFLSAETLCGYMLKAQEEGYGDGLNADCKHPYMWVCKGHYYSADLAFYNFPYAFGGLLSTGLYAMYEEDPKGFDAKYQKFLAETTVNTIEGAAASVGIDVTSESFWKKGLEKYKTYIDRFCALAERK